MKYTILKFEDLSADVCLSCFAKDDSSEYHVIIEGNDTFLDVATQYGNIEKALTRLVQTVLPTTATLVMKRWFTSDAVNHEAFVTNDKANSAVSIVQQPPLSGAKAALWAYFAENAKVSVVGENSIIMQRSAYRHLFDMQMHSRSCDEFSQTEDIFETYNHKLQTEGCTLADNAIRTWIFVQDVDNRYAGMVKARKQRFYEHGLNEKTHYIASTGIEGRYVNPQTTVLMDAYAIKGLADGQTVYLKGASHLSPTYDYGVTFERATAVDYGDRRHIFVSGTASIDDKGNILYPCDIRKQTERTLENIEVLLHEGDATMMDIAQMIVYLRDIADYGVVSLYLEEKYPEIPKTIVLAAVCRPAWLIEIECIAITKCENGKYAEW